MAMDHFSYADTVRAALASCLPCFSTVSRSSELPSNAPTYSEQRSTSVGARSTSTTSNDLEHLLRDPDSDVLSLHSNLGAGASSSTTPRRARRRRRPKFSLTLFGYTLFGRAPIYLSDDDGDSLGGGRSSSRALGTVSSSTLDSDAAPLDASTIERLTSPDHFAALAAQRERERRQLEAEEEARRKAERRARRRERKARERASEAALMALSLPDDDEVGAFEGFQGSGAPIHVASPFDPHQPYSDTFSPIDDVDGPSDADDADLGGELYARKKKISAALSASGSDSRSRTSASFSAGDPSNPATHLIQTPIPYPHTEMRFPAPTKIKSSRRASKQTSTVSSVTSQSTSPVPYTPVDVKNPAVAAFPVPQERHVREGGQVDFPSVGLSGARRPKLDPRPFLVHQA